MNDNIPADERAPFSYTPGPWRVGTWAGHCRKPHPTRDGLHPGPGGADGCEYEYSFQLGSPDDHYMPGIAGPQSKQMVVDTSYDSLCIRWPDAVLISAAPEMYEALRLVRRIWAKDDSCEEIRAIDAAIAKAEGRL